MSESGDLALCDLRFVCPMVLGLLQFELSIPGAESLKDKRRVVSSVKDRLHREHQASVAEVGALDRPASAVMALSVVATEGRRVGELFDQITAKLRALPDAELGETRRDIFTSGALDAMRDEPDRPQTDESLRREMLARAREAGEEGAVP